jgi:hypothetical protein
MCSPRPTHEKYRPPRAWRGHRRLHFPEYPPEVLASARRVALAEQDFGVPLDLVADRDQLAARVDRDEVAHQVVAARASIRLPGARHAQAHVDELRGTLEIARKQLADILAKHVERGTAVELDEHVRDRLGDPMARRRAACSPA